jgi:type I restriction enzyme R subunit
MDLLQERRAALISAAVTGKIDVRGLVEAVCRRSGRCMTLHKEISFEDEICGPSRRGRLAHMPRGDAAQYDRARALFPPDMMDWVKATQPTAWQTLTKNHGTNAKSILLDRIRKQLDDRGTLDVLRHGVELIGLRQPISLAQFKPALAMNARHPRSLCSQRLRVVRQVRYSSTNENCIDLVLFLNGLPGRHR